VTLLRAILVLLFVTGVQAGLGRLWPAALRFVDLTFLPVLWYGIRGGQRTGMLIGCASGLLQDAWLEVGVFGLNGFKKTLEGWALGGFGSRFELNGPAGRLIGGAVLVLCDAPLDWAVRRLLDLGAPLPSLMDLVLRALITGLIAMWSFGVVERLRERRSLGRWVTG